MGANSNWPLRDFHQSILYSCMKGKAHPINAIGESMRRTTRVIYLIIKRHVTAKNTKETIINNTAPRRLKITRFKSPPTTVASNDFTEYQSAKPREFINGTDSPLTASRAPPGTQPGVGVGSHGTVPGATELLRIES